MEERPGPGATSPGPPGEESDDSGARSFVGETMRKAVLAGLGAVFLTEENARKLARDWKLPKDIATFLLAQIGSARGEIVRAVNDEVRKFFESEALRREFLRLLSSMTIEVRAEISLKPAPDGGGGVRVEPQVKVTSVRPRQRKPTPAEPEGGEGAAGRPERP